MINLNEYVGVLSPFDLLSTSLKREVLFFDKIAIPNVLNDFIFKDTLMKCPIRAIEYLIQNNIIVDPVEKYIGIDSYLKKINSEMYGNRMRLLKEREYELAAELDKPIIIDPSFEKDPLIRLMPANWLKAFSKLRLNLEYKIGVPFAKFALSCASFMQQLDYDRRGIAADLRSNFLINAFPLYSQQIDLENDFVSGQDDVITLLIDNLPEPDCDSVSWEQLIDFKNEPETQKRLLFLRHWIIESCKKEVTYRELSQELEYQIGKYKEHIALQKLKLNYGVIETLLMIPAEMIEGILQQKPTQTVKALFTFKHQKIKFLENEAKAPGRDLAYLIKASETFRTISNKQG